MTSYSIGDVVDVEIGVDRWERGTITLRHIREDEDIYIVTCNKLIAERYASQIKPIFTQEMVEDRIEWLLSL